MGGWGNCWLAMNRFTLLQADCEDHRLVDIVNTGAVIGTASYKLAITQLRELHLLGIQLRHLRGLTNQPIEPFKLRSCPG